MDADLQALCDAKDGEMYKMQAEIDRLRSEVVNVTQQCGQLRQRMQIMREWMLHFSAVEWTRFVMDYPEAAEWFDSDGVPR